MVRVRLSLGTGIRVRFKIGVKVGVRVMVNVGYGWGWSTNRLCMSIKNVNNETHRRSRVRVSSNQMHFEAKNDAARAQNRALVRATLGLMSGWD